VSRRNTKSHVAVERHLEERAQYEAWIAKLDSGASTVPAPVLERVRADYRSRLDRVTRELARYEKDLETSLAESEVRRDDLVTQRTARSEALAETELRHHVGEYDDAKFHEQSAEAQVALAQLAEEIAATERDIAKFEEILGLIAGALPETPEPAPAPLPRCRPLRPGRPHRSRPPLGP
jgi:chromosome segregation ATPase